MKKGIRKNWVIFAVVSCNYANESLACNHGSFLYLIIQLSTWNIFFPSHGLMFTEWVKNGSFFSWHYCRPDTKITKQRKLLESLESYRQKWTEGKEALHWIESNCIRLPRNCVHSATFLIPSNEMRKESFNKSPKL